MGVVTGNDADKVKGAVFVSMVTQSADAVKYALAEAPNQLHRRNLTPNPNADPNGGDQRGMD